MRARHGCTARRARVPAGLWLNGTAAALLVLLAVLFASPAGVQPGAAAGSGGEWGTAHVLESHLLTSAATPLRPDISARTLFMRSQPPMRRAWPTRADVAHELVLSAHHADRELHAVAIETYLRHSHDLLIRKTGSVSSRTTSLPPPSAG